MLSVSLHVGETYFTLSELYPSIHLQVTMHDTQNAWLQFERITKFLMVWETLFVDAFSADSTDIGNVVLTIEGSSFIHRNAG